MGIDDRYWMQLAYQQALQAQSLTEVPIGAVLVAADNQTLLGQGFNRVISDHDPTAHAEINAIREAAKKVNNYRLLNTTLYVTLEPCSMCAGALVQSRVKRVVFAARDFKAGAAGSICNLLSGHPFNHAVIIDEGILQHECVALLSQFFMQRR